MILFGVTWSFSRPLDSSVPNLFLFNKLANTRRTEVAYCEGFRMPTADGRCRALGGRRRKTSKGGNRGKRDEGGSSRTMGI
jgi:hypothetical protein